ncbi:membrane protein implicated in regulation of membrane protease activity [Lysobacter niabensis]|uniref:Membrane protein implicated in regulation of membrane protease activity n=1 Tax=Agrilutibacter niabensis TaxID=380628 RepID=A0ABU1VQS0_9GAMM|nr:membrane protein implicated in regulation of membrane protease activity [Lysobacter niabensis]
MSASGQAMDEPHSDDTTPNPDARKPPAPDLAESLRQVGDAGRAGLKAANDAAKALRVLVSADLSLARSALGRALAFTGVAIAFGASAWILLMAAVTAVLHDALGWSWTLSLAVCAATSLVITALGMWRAVHYFEHTRMQATRRQLARLGIGELAAFMPDADSGESTRHAAERVAEATSDKPVKKGLGIDVTPP